MKLLSKKKPPIETTEDNSLIGYIEKCLGSGQTMEVIKKTLEKNKEDGNYTSEDIEAAILSVESKIKAEEQAKLDLDVERKIKKHPKKIRKKLRMLYEDYKNGKVIFPEGFDKGKYLNKQ